MLAGHLKYIYCASAGLSGTRFSQEELAAAGLLEFTSGSPSGLGCRGGPEATSTEKQSLIPVGPGLAALPKRLMERLRANEFIDFMELPPARGKSRPITQDLEGRVLVVQAADLAQSRKLIPDLATWLQCFALYTAAVLQEHQERAAELMAYQSIIAKASLRYKWPSWVIYDMSFRQEMAGVTGESWARVDPSIYSLCFNGQAICNENWCPTCQTLDHTQQTFPNRPRQ